MTQTTKTNAIEISQMPKLKPMYTEDGVRIKGIYRSR